MKKFIKNTFNFLKSVFSFESKKSQNSNITKSTDILLDTSTFKNIPVENFVHSNEENEYLNFFEGLYKDRVSDLKSSILVGVSDFGYSGDYKNYTVDEKNNSMNLIENGSTIRENLTDFFNNLKEFLPAFNLNGTYFDSFYQLMDSTIVSFENELSNSFNFKKKLNNFEIDFKKRFYYFFDK